MRRLVVVLAAFMLAGSTFAGVASAELSPARAVALWQTLNAHLRSGQQPTAGDVALLRKLLTYAHTHWRTDPVEAAILRGFISRANENATEANVRAAVPSAEAYYADHASRGYAGMTDAVLRTYDRGMRAHVAWAERGHYCLESVIVSHSGILEGHSFAAHFVGPGSKVSRGAC
jgi:hypothetical protein